MSKLITADLDFDPQRLEIFLRTAIPGLQGSMKLEQISGGQSNPTFFVDYENRSMVLRKQPASNVLLSAHAIDREYRVMHALAETDVPVPKMVLFHPGREVIGTPFYIMERLEGRVFSECALPGMQPSERRAIYLAMADTMARVHKVDWKAIGLADYGRPGDYFTRQIARWTKQWSASKTHENPELEQLISWLPNNVPAGDEITISHGDFRLGNLMFHPSEPRVIGVLDWELSTLGHPLADVAYNCIAWRTLPSEYGGIRGLDLATLGIPTEVEYLQHYYQRSGRTNGVTSFHFAFALFRLSVIFEGIAARALNGSAASDNAAEVGVLGLAFARRGVEFIDDLSQS